MREVTVKGWSFQVDIREEVFSENALNETKRIFTDWKKAFPMENTWSRRNYSVPSFIVRLDCVVHEGKLLVYEIEERPAGIGVSSKINPLFESKLQKMIRLWPSFYVVVSDKRRGGDDVLWARVISLEEALTDSKRLVLVRAEPEETQFHQLGDRSVSSLKTKGSKSYGLTLGWWREVGFDEFDELPWDIGFTVKPIQGSKCRDVLIWNAELKKSGGISTRKKIRETFKKHGRMFVQPFIPPMTACLNGSRYLMIYRMFFGYNPANGEYIPLGGVWNAREDQFKIHGAKDAVFGPLVFA